VLQTQIFDYQSHVMCLLQFKFLQLSKFNLPIFRSLNYILNVKSIVRIDMYQSLVKFLTDVLIIINRTPCILLAQLEILFFLILNIYFSKNIRF